jgi:putative (di)nucleoside polyphosphate hydrolase
MIIGEGNRVLAFRRKGTPSKEKTWQMPQGGIGIDETPTDAVWRELREEAGLTPDDLELVTACDQWIVYEVPKEYRSPKVGWGQAQRWFLFRAKSGLVVNTDGAEFDAYAWLTPAELLTRAVEFRKPVYERVFSEFSDWLSDDQTI